MLLKTESIVTAGSSAVLIRGVARWERRSHPVSHYITDHFSNIPGPDATNFYEGLDLSFPIEKSPCGDGERERERERAKIFLLERFGIGLYFFMPSLINFGI